MIALNVDIEMLNKDIEALQTKVDDFKGEKELFKIEQQALQQDLDQYELLKAEKEQKITNATQLAGDSNDVNSVGCFEKKMQTTQTVKK